jgi:histone H4
MESGAVREGSCLITPAFHSAADFLMLAGPARGRLHQLAGVGPEALERSGGGAGLCPEVYSELLAARLGLVAVVADTATDTDRYGRPEYRYYPAGRAKVGEGATEATNPATDEPWTGEEVAAALAARGGADGGWLTWAELYSHNWRPEEEEEDVGDPHAFRYRRTFATVAAPKQSAKKGKSSMAGKASKGKLGTGGSKRHRRVLRDNIQGVTAPMLTALMRKAGLPAEDEGTALCFEESRGILKTYLERVIRIAVTCTEHARSKVVSAEDMLKGLEGQGAVRLGLGRVVALHDRSSAL